MTHFSSLSEMWPLLIPPNYVLHAQHSPLNYNQNFNINALVERSTQPSGNNMVGTAQHDGNFTPTILLQ